MAGFIQLGGDVIDYEKLSTVLKGLSGIDEFKLDREEKKLEFKGRKDVYDLMNLIRDDVGIPSAKLEWYELKRSVPRPRKGPLPSHCGKCPKYNSSSSSLSSSSSRICSHRRQNLSGGNDKRGGSGGGSGGGRSHIGSPSSKHSGNGNNTRHSSSHNKPMAMDAPVSGGHCLPGDCFQGTLRGFAPFASWPYNHMGSIFCCPQLPARIYPVDAQEKFPSRPLKNLSRGSGRSKK